MIDQYTYLCISGADPNIGRLAHTAANADRVDVLKLLLDAGAPVDGPKGARNTVTALDEIMMNSGSLECAQVLIERGADISYLKNEAPELVKFALLECSLELLNFLLEHISEDIVLDRECLKIAIQTGHPEIVLKLLDRYHWLIGAN